MSSANTLSALLVDILRREKNSLELLETLSTIFSSREDSVVIVYQNSDGTEQEMTIPSYGFLLTEIDRINRDIASMAGLGAQSASIKLPDGSYRTIFTSEPATEPDVIRNITRPTIFYNKLNKFYEGLLNPVPFIKVNMADKINDNVSQIYVKKLLMNIDTTQNVDYFNTVLNGNNIDYNVLKTNLDNQGIVYSEYDQVYQLPPRFPKYKGTFDVINITKKEVTELINDVSITTTEQAYKLNTLLFKDMDDNQRNIALTKDMILILNKNNKSTKFIIKSVDTGTNEIIVKRSEGQEIPTVGTDIFMIEPSISDSLIFDIPVNQDEYVSVFFKAINPNSNIVNTEWGDGICILTNELISSDDGIMPLPEYFTTYIQNIGDSLNNIAKDKPISYVDGIKPDAPSLVAENFKVLQINTHKDQNKFLNDLRQKFDDKNKVKAEIDSTDTAINTLKNKIATSNFASNNEKTTAQKQLSDLIAQRTSLTNQFASLVNDILGRTKDAALYSPKYSVRGFFPIPEPKYKDSGAGVGKQEAIGFIRRYRYLTTENTSANTQKLDYDDGTGTKVKATFSSWVEMRPVYRRRGTDTNGNLIWLPEDTNDPDAINANQIDVAITADESVEIQVKTLSEAGYPSSPMESDWSQSIIIAFPDELKDDTDVIFNQANQEEIKAQFQQELNAVGLPQHLADSQTLNEQYIAHFASSIATSDKTPENKPIDVDTALKTLRSQVESLNAIISGVQGKMAVSILDEQGNLIQDVNNNDTINIFSGYYRDMVNSLTIAKGGIITKTYYIQIANLSSADLELLSYHPGSYKDAVVNNSNFSTYPGYIINRDEYINYRKYFNVPVSLRSMIASNQDFIDNHTANTKPFLELPSFQSSQVKGQFIYGRNIDVNLGSLLYGEDASVLPIFPSSGTTQSYIWDGLIGGSSPSGSGYESDFCIHMLHPDLADTNSDFWQKRTTLWQNGSSVIPLPIRTSEAAGTPVYYPNFMHGSLAKLESNETNGLLQNSYRIYTKVTSGPIAVNNFPNKVGFSPADQYLIGKNTVGSYLFLAPSDNKSLFTGSPVYNEGIIIKNGNSYALRVKVIHQFRMTDFNGDGTTGTGVIGGLGSGKTNLTYSKKIGFDIAIKNQPLFSFDLVATAQYKPISVGQ